MKILESFLPKLFIALIPSEQGVHLRAELRKNAKILRRFEELNIQSAESLEKQIRKLELEHPVCYTAFLESEAEQGVIPDCRVAEGIESGSVERICIDNSWGLYIAHDDLFARQSSYKNIGLDFLISPFSLLYEFYQEKLQKSDGLYLLLGEGFIVSCVYKDGALLFGKYFKTQEDVTALSDINLLDRYVDMIQLIVKAFYDEKADDTMFIEKIYIADALNFDSELENRVEEALFAEVEKCSIDLPHELILLSEKEL